MCQTWLKSLVCRSFSQTVIALDLYLAYLRAAFNTCYYCAVIADHLEELQRKCIKHVRKPLSKMMLQELQAAEAQKAEKVEEDADAPKKEETGAKEKTAEARDWKRNGMLIVPCNGTQRLTSFTDERWLEWLDSKVALLIDRNGVDPRDYGGKSLEEYVYMKRCLVCAVNVRLLESSLALVNSTSSRRTRASSVARLARNSSRPRRSLRNTSRTSIPSL